MARSKSFDLIKLKLRLSIFYSFLFLSNQNQSTEKGYLQNMSDSLEPTHLHSFSYLYVCE